MKDRSKTAIFCAALGNVLWGFSFLLTSVGLRYVPSPNVMLAHRFLLSTLFMGVLLITGKGKYSFKGKNWKAMGLLLLLQVCYYLLETYGIKETNSTFSGLVLATVPVVAIGTGALFLREYPTRRQALFCILPVAGVILMTISGKELGVVSPLGLTLLILTMLASAFFKTANRKTAETFSPFERTFSVLSVSAVVFTIIGLSSVKWSFSAFAAPLLEVRYVLPVVSLSLLCSIGANMLVNYASGQMSVFKLSAFGSLCTLCSTLAGVLIAKDPVDWMLILGAVLILVGIRQVTKPK